jgi:hypothetical protein
VCEVFILLQVFSVAFLEGESEDLVRREMAKEFRD